MYKIKKEGVLPKEIISIDDYCNTGNDYRPRADFNVVYNDKGFHVHFDVYESNPKADYVNNFDPVCCDSCVEWFVYFDPDICDRYFNFEVNSNGVMDVAFRKDRYIFDKLTDEDIASFNIVTEVKDDIWSVDYTIPYEFIEKYIKDYKFRSGAKLIANVYKCCSVQPIRHCGCWAMVDRNAPDFHKPEYFKTMEIV